MGRIQGLHSYRVEEKEIRCCMSTKTQILIYILVLAVFDTIIPIPITALVLVHILYQKPKWFREWVDEVYRF